MSVLSAPPRPLNWSRIKLMANPAAPLNPPAAPRVYLEQGGYRKCSFAEWVKRQPELHHLAHHLTLDT